MRVLPLWFTQADYSKAFLEAHREKITLHKAPRRAAISPPGPFLFSDIFPTVGKRGRIGAKLIYDQQEGENQDGNGLYRRRMPLGRTAFFDTVPGVQMTEAGRANGTTSSLDGPYDGYAECVKVVYDEKNTSISELMAHLFEIIDPYSLNKQGMDVGKKYRTGLYSTDPRHLEEARAFINGREDRDKIMLEVLPLTNYVRSAEEHQHHLERHPEDCSYCHIPDAVLNRYRNQ